MAKLVSMRISAKDRDAKNSPAEMASESPAYPWGLSINLDTDALKKLGYKAGDFKVGAKMAIIANVEVSSVSSNETRGAGDSSSVGLQIVELCVEDDAVKKSNATKVLYGETDK